jgi:hypothetical protein
LPSGGDIGRSVVDARMSLAAENVVEVGSRLRRQRDLHPPAFGNPVLRRVMSGPLTSAATVVVGQD